MQYEATEIENQILCGEVPGLGSKAPLHRQYFHNKPLSQAQLDAWRCYLDFEESGPRGPRPRRELRHGTGL